MKPVSNVDENYILSPIINENFSIKYQLLTSFSILSIFSGIITLSVCYGLLYSVDNQSLKSAENVLKKQTLKSALTLSNDISAAISQQINAKAQTGVVMESLYAAILLNYTKDTSLENVNNVSILSIQNYYKEYDFIKDCIFPKCPRDTKLLQQSNRFPNFYRNRYGSMSSTSVYLYSYQSNTSVKDDNLWDLYYNASSMLRRVIHGLSYMDSDLSIIYNNNNDPDITFSISVLVEDNKNSSNNFVIARYYPGVSVDSFNYNPAESIWFKNAPLNAFYFSGPYNEGFISSSNYYMSGKQILNYPNISITIVSNVLFLYDSLQEIVNRFSYPYKGFGALLNYDTLKVLVWGSKDISYDLLSIYDYEPLFASPETIRSYGYFYYTDSDDINWLVVSNPLVESQNFQHNVNQFAFVLLIFSKVSELNEPITMLKSHIATTNRSIIFPTIFICCGIIIFNIIIIKLFVSYFVYPLEVLRRISQDIVQKSLDSHNNANDSNLVIENYQLSMNRTDEVGLLAIDYIDMIIALNNKNKKRVNIRKYLENIFHKDSLYDEIKKEIDWHVLSQHITENSKSFPTYPSGSVRKDEHNNICIDLDNINQFNTSHKFISQFSFQLSNKSYDREDRTEKSLSNDFICKSTVISSAKVVLSMLSIIILLGLLIVMIISASNLKVEGKQWIVTTNIALLNSYRQVLDTFSEQKAIYSYSYFRQIGAELLTSSMYLQSIINQNFTSIDIINNGRYLPSYSLDPYNPYVSNQPYSIEYSMYFLTSDANCNYTECSKSHNSLDVKMTSLYDIKMKSLYYVGNNIEFVQMGNFQGLTRYIPKLVSSTYSRPTSCSIASTIINECKSKYDQSSCNPEYSGTVYYPPYDCRCRSWYTLGSTAKPNVAIYQSPGKSISGSYVLTVVSSIVNETDNSLYGVQNINIDFNGVSVELNSLKILNKGYSYIVETNNPTKLVYHPYTNYTCTVIRCAESSMTNDEYLSFFTNILSKIQTMNISNIPTSYMKGGMLWQISCQNIVLPGLLMTLVVTVPQNDIIEPLNNVQAYINKTYNKMIIVFSFVIIFFIVLFFYLVLKLIKFVIYPINQLRILINRVIHGEFIDFSQVHALSYDIKVLLNAFSNLMIVLKFGNDIFLSGDSRLAKDVLTNTLFLYNSINNIYHIAINQNNLGCIELDLGNYQVAESYFLESIRNYNILLYSCDDENHIYIHLQYNLSDTISNLSLLYLQQSTLSKRMDLLMNQLSIDYKINHLIGIVVKFGVLGYYYIQLNDHVNGLKYFNDSYDYIINNEKSNDYSIQQIELSKQIALYNITIYYEYFHKSNDSLDDLVNKYVDSLIIPKYSNKNLIIKLFYNLKRLFLINDLNNHVVSLNILFEKLINQNNFSVCNIFNEYENISISKRNVYFCIDNSNHMDSYNMDDVMIKLNQIVNNHINYYDKIMVLHYNDHITIDIELNQKKFITNDLSFIKNSISNPSGNSCFFEVISFCIEQFQFNSISSDDYWIVIFFGGRDNCSNISIDILCEKLKLSNAKVVFICLQSVHSNDLLDLFDIIDSAERGIYIPPLGSINCLSSLFGNVKCRSIDMAMFQDT